MMKKIIHTVADGGGELGVHLYPLPISDKKTFVCKIHFEKGLGTVT